MLRFIVVPSFSLVLRYRHISRISNLKKLHAKYFFLVFFLESIMYAYHRNYHRVNFKKLIRVKNAYDNIKINI